MYGGADVPLFETIKKTQEFITAVSFGMVVAFMMFIMELRRNGGEIAATAENHHLPPNFSFAVFRWNRRFWIIEAILFVFNKITLMFLHITTKKYKGSLQKS